jgi:hypothetical protein
MSKYYYIFIPLLLIYKRYKYKNIWSFCLSEAPIIVLFSFILGYDHGVFTVAFFILYEIGYIINDEIGVMRKDHLRRYKHSILSLIVRIAYLALIIYPILSHIDGSITYLSLLIFVFIFHNIVKIIKPITFIILRVMKYSAPLYMTTGFVLFLLVSSIVVVYDYKRYLADKNYNDGYLYFIFLIFIVGVTNLVFSTEYSLSLLFIAYLLLIYLIKNKSYIYYIVTRLLKK